MKQNNSLENFNVNIKLKLALIWTSFIFLYIYVDHFALYMPNTIENIMKGKVFVFDISQGFILFGIVSMTIPTSMIFLSVLMPARINRLTNIIVAAIYIPYMLFNLAGEAWLHMIFAAAVEIIMLCLIIGLACKWPRIN